MKTFQKIALVSAIATAPFAAQAMEALDDSVLGETTGQAGVTIDLDIGSAGLTVGSVVYTDEGNLTVNKIALKPKTGTLKLSQTIDIEADGDLVMVTTPSGGSQDLLVTVGDIQLGGTSDKSELLSNLAMDVTLEGSSTTRINNVNTLTETLGTYVTGLDATTAAQKVGLVIEAGASFKINDLDVGVFGYTEAQATAQTTVLDTGVQGSNAVAVASANKAIAARNAASSGADVANVVAGTALTQDQKDAVQGVIANGSAIQVTDLTMNNNGNAITMNQKIWASSAGVSIQISSLDADIAIGGISIGGASIGSLAINDLSLAGLTQTIRGH